MGSGVFRPTTVVLNALILVFSACLVYFVFFYYPSVVKSARFELPIKQLFKEKVVVDAQQFPISTQDYKIVYEEGSSLYYIFPAGETLGAFVSNKQAAELTLKNTLQTETLCSHKVIITPNSSLDVADSYKAVSGCN